MFSHKKKKNPVEMTEKIPTLSEKISHSDSHIASNKIKNKIARKEENLQ